MVRSRYIIMKEASYFPESELYDAVQKKKAARKFHLVNAFHQIFLVLTMLVLWWCLTNVPSRIDVFQQCVEHKNVTYNLTDEEVARNQYYWTKEAFLALDNFNNTDATYSYNPYNTTVPFAVMKELDAASRFAWDQWYGTYNVFRDCVGEEMKNRVGGISNLSMGFIVIYAVIFLISLFVREIFLVYFVKPEYTASEWKRESANNTLYIFIWIIASIFFVTYLFWYADRFAAKLSGVIGKYWGI